MTVDDFDHLTDHRPEWRRSGHFVAIAIVLHAVVLAVPLHQALSQLSPPPLNITLVEPPHPPEPHAIAAPKPLPKEDPRPAPVVKSVPAPKPRPMLAMTPEQQPIASSTPTVAPPTPVVDTPVIAAKPGPVSAPAPVAISAARFDAAYLQNPKPNYPALSRRLGEEGKVLLKVRVTADGRPAAVDLEKSSNFERLDVAARQAVEHWRFVPAKRGDEAVEASVIVPIVFRLDS